MVKYIRSKNHDIDLADYVNSTHRQDTTPFTLLPVVPVLIGMVRDSILELFGALSL